MNKPTFCFATMCKNEQHCILETLESVYKYCDYWVICDTGSTDNTCGLIQQFFKQKNIPGELFIDEWKGFGYNKTLLFQRCYKKTDYIIHCDADDLLLGDFNFNIEDTGKIAYEVTMKRGSFNYTNLVIFNNKYHWKICGAAHTYAKCLDNIDNLPICNFAHKPFFILSRDTGSRSNDSEKYSKDAILLKTQFFDTLVYDIDNLNTRSVFYTAQSYYDSGNYIDSLKWYNLYTKLKNIWDEELFQTYLKISNCYKNINNNVLLFNKYAIIINPMLSVFLEPSEPPTVGTVCKRRSPTLIDEPSEDDKNDSINIVKNIVNQNIISNLYLASNLFSDRAEPYYELGHYFFDNNFIDKAFVFFKIAQNMNYNNVKLKYTLFINEFSYGSYNDEYVNKCIQILKGLST